MNSNRLSFFFLIIIGIFSNSCSKKITGISWDFGDRKKLEVHEVDFEYFSGKAKIKYKDEELDIKAKANIRIRKDSVIWIDFSAVGIHGARCLINKDSVTIMNMIKKEYYVFKYDSLSEQYNFDINYAAIQSAALGNLIMNNDKSDVVESDNDYYVLKQNSGDVSFNNYVNAKTMKIERVEMLELSSKNSAVIRYGDFNMVGDYAFPFSEIVLLFYKTEKGTLNTAIEFEYNKAVIEDKELKFPFNIPKKYVRK